GVGIWGLPDMRQLLFWKPSEMVVKAGKSSFWASYPNFVSISSNGSVVVFGTDSGLLCIFGPQFERTIFLRSTGISGVEKMSPLSASFNSKGDKLITIWGVDAKPPEAKKPLRVCIWTLPDCQHVLTFVHTWAKSIDVDDSGQIAATVDTDRVLRI